MVEGITPLMWQLAAIASFTLNSADGRAIVSWKDGQGRICPPDLAPGAPAPPPAPPVDPAAPPPPAWPPAPACVAFDAANTRVGGTTWRVIDPTDTKLERPPVAEIVWTDPVHAKVTVFVPPPPARFKPPPDFVAPANLEVEVGLPDTSRPPPPHLAVASADGKWKLMPTGFTSAEYPLEPGAALLPVLPAAEPPKPAPKLKAGEPRPTESVASAVPGTWAPVALDCDRAKLGWMFTPLLEVVPVPDPNAKPAPKPKGEPVPPPPPPEPVVWMYQIAPQPMFAPANAVKCGDPDSGWWTGVRALAAAP